MATYDYIVVGAGSAGCVLANRLTADGSSSVLLIEAGGSDWHPTIRMPGALSLPMNNPRFNWFFWSEPEPGLGGRRLHSPRGKVLGGSSSINGMVHVRGNANDYERWQALGAQGWSYADVVPYFKRSENAIAARADDLYRGRGGPLVVTRGRQDNPLYGAFLEACEQAGHTLSEDLNGFRQEGFGALEMTVDRGVRCSAARAYLAPAASRDNLTTLSGASVERIRLDGGRASKVAFRAKGRLEVAEARREVVLSAGAIGSPHLLMLSGIGPPDELAKHGIKLAHALPGVGLNLMDHLEIYLQQSCTKPITLNRWLHPAGKGLIAAQWLLTRSGLGATNHFEAGGFVRSRADAPWPDIQFHFLPAAVSYDGTARAPRHGFQVHAGPMLSASRGEVRLRSADPGDKPLLRFNYMSCADDWTVFRSAVRRAREIFSQEAFDGYGGPELSPGTAVESDEAVDAFVRRHAQSAYHPCGTCRMGHDDLAVVDAACRVHGIDGLRVVDASVFPHITNGNLNAPTIMVAEKAADSMLGRGLPPEPLPYFSDTNDSRHPSGGRDQADA